MQLIRSWLGRMGRQRYPKAQQLTTDCGGSNGARVRLWKIELLKLADETCFGKALAQPIGDGQPLLARGSCRLLREGSADRGGHHLALLACDVRQSIPHEVHAAALP